jgi:imidazolonepropionase-like amidohydrolase
VSEKRLVLHNTTYFDSVNGKMEEGKTIVLKDKAVNWIGDYSSFEKEENDEILELEGKYVLPGLIDCHVHLDLRDEGENPYQAWATTSPFLAGYKALKSAQEHLQSGFTTVRDCGGENWGQSLNRIFSSGLYRGPRVLAAQYPLSQLGSITYDLPIDLNLAFQWLNTEKLAGILFPTGVDEIILAVRERREKGSGFIKVLNTGALYAIVFGSNIEDTFFREDEMFALVDEAHRNGLHVACHSHADKGINEALDAGVDTIEHGMLISEATSKKMAKTKAYLIPTYLVDNVRHNPERMKEYPGFIEKMNSIIETKYTNHRIAFEAGVKFALGTDAGTVDAPHGTSAKEFALMIENLGMTPVQALQSATIDAAKAIQLEDTIGSIEVGKAGDVIVVRLNPLDDVTILEDATNIEYVVKDANIVAEKGVLL